MKKVYLTLTILGLVLNLTTMWNETISGNFLLWGNPARTNSLAFANEISSIFMLDLFYVVLVYFIWAAFDSKRTGMKRWWLTIFWTLIFGLAVGLPLFFYQREVALEKS